MRGNIEMEERGLVGRKNWQYDNSHIHEMEALINVATGLLEILKDKPETENALDKTGEEHLRWMLNEIISMNKTGTKASRWLGFVQGVMVMRGYITVDGERDRTRPIFNGVRVIS